MVARDATATAKSIVNSVILCRRLLRSCATGDRPWSDGHQLHAVIIKAGLLLQSSILSNISSALFHMYAAIGPPASALRAFKELPSPSCSAADWTALISTHVRHALPFRALLLFRSMRRCAVASPDEVTLITVLSASARLVDCSSGASSHLLFVKLGLPFTDPARNAVMDMYAKCGRMDEMRKLFEVMQNPSVVSWTIVLAGALRWEGLSSGQEMFDRMPQRNEVAWTVMVSAYVEVGLSRNALVLLGHMMFGECSVASLNHVSMCSLLSACSQVGDLTVGRWVHCHSIKAANFNSSTHLVMVNTALIDMYGKCGRMDRARIVFERMPQRNIVAWNALLTGLSMHGMGVDVLHWFSKMVTEEEQKPDDITLVSVLSACSRSGLVEQGWKVFHDLVPVYGLKPKVEHYACIVDLLGRAGELEEAEALVREMPMRPNEVVLGSLLASCSLHGKLELGKELMQELVQLYPNNTEYHVLLSNMYMGFGRHAEADDLREALRRRGVQKAPGVSFVEINGSLHQFCAGDKSHPRTREIYAMLDEMVWRLQLAGYVANLSSQNTRFSDNYIANGDDREEQEQALLTHSERLAVSLGLISTGPGMPLRIFKNLRICLDCHSFMKLVSDIFDREIVVRDRNRFHCFKQGSCSCADYW